MGYNKCLVNIDKDDAIIVSDFAGLHPDFKKWVGDRDDVLSIPSVNIIKYIVACYDHESDIVRQHKTRWTMKKREAAKLSGILFMRDSAGNDIDDILYCKNEVLNKITVRYLALLSDRDFMMYAIKNELLTKQATQLLDYDYSDPSKVSVANKNIEIAQDDILKLEQKMFSGDDVRALKNILQEEATKFMVDELRPENLVSKHEKGDLVIESPYGKGYQIPDLKFVDDK